MPTRLPTVTADTAAPVKTAIILPELFVGTGNMPLIDFIVLLRLAAARAPKKIFEIGTFEGRTALALAMNCPDAHIWTLDLPPATSTKHDIEAAERAFVDKPVSGHRFQRAPEAERIHQLYGDSATFDYSAYSADFIFIDGSHAYEYVLDDSVKTIELLSPSGGTMVWHDYGEWDGVTRALEHLAATDARFAGIRSIEGTTLAMLTVSSSSSSS
jgi:predicted O-methyltransferase YrrM